MARVTIERLLDKVDSRFELVLLAAYRAHAIAYGSQAVVNTNDKYAVLALREMESGKVSVDELKDIVLKKYALEATTDTTANSFVANDFSFEEYMNGDKATNNIDINSNVGVEGDKEIELKVAKDYFAN